MIVSIEDSREYQADMVLATLLDDSTPPTQPSTAASTSSSSSIPPAITQRTAAATATRGRQQQAGSAVTILDEDQDGIRDNGEAGALEQTTGNNSRLDQHLCDGGGGPSLSFPSGSQFRKKVPRKSSAIAQVVHIPQPPQDVEFMETDSLLHEDDDIGLGDHFSNSHVEGLGRESHAFSQHLGSHASSSHVTEEDDVMDALFGEDNLDGVADHGEVFGFDQGQNRESQMLPRNQRGSIAASITHARVRDVYLEGACIGGTHM